MSRSIEEVGVDLKVNRNTLTPELRAARAEAAATSRELRDIGGAGINRGLLDLQGNMGGLSTHVQGLHRNLLGASTALGQFAGSQMRAAGLGLGVVTAAAGGFGLVTEASFERSRAAFSTLLDDVSAGQSLFDELRAFNLETPFGLGDITGATQSLLQFDVAGNDVMTTLRSLSDVAALTTNPSENLQRMAIAVGQINQAGVMRAEDLNQLVQAGFPAYKVLTEITGQTTAELRKQMESGLDLPATDFIDAINTRAGVLGRYANGAKEQAQTLSGVWSNFTDTLKVDLAESTQPLAEGLKAELPEITKDLHGLLTEVAPPLTTLAVDVLGGVSRALTAAAPLLTAITSGLRDFGEAAGPGLVGLGPVIGQLTMAVTGLFQDLTPHAPELVGLMVDLVGILPEMVDIMADLVPVAVALVDGLSGLLELDGAQQVAGGLLITLLAYRALSGVVTTVLSLAGAFRSLAAAEVAADIAGGNVGPGATAAAGRGARLARGAGGAALFGLSLTQEPSVLGDLSTVGGGALAGSAFGLPGALVGGAIGLGTVVGRRLADDDPAPHAVTPALAPSTFDPTVHVDSRTDVGGIQILNPRDDADITAAVAEGIRLADEERIRREVD